MPSTTNRRHEATKPRAEAHHNKNHNKQQHHKQPPRRPAPPSRQRSKGSLKRLPAAAQREVDAYTSWLEQPTKDGKGWTYGLRELQLAASQDCVGCLLIADDSLDAHYSSTDPAVTALAKRVRASKGVVHIVAVAEVAGVCGLAGRLRRSVGEEEEEAWQEELRLMEATVPAMSRSLSKLVGPALDEGSDASCGSSLGDEARDELTLIEASFAIDGQYRRLTQAPFQLLVDADADAGFLVMEVGLPEAYPSAAPTVRIHGSSRVHGSNMSRAMRAAASNALEASMQQNVGTPMLFELHEAARAWLEEA